MCRFAGGCESVSTRYGQTVQSGLRKIHLKSMLAVLPTIDMQPTDKELLISCRGGDESSWQALVDRYQRLIYAIPRRAGLNEDQAGEVF